MTASPERPAWTSTYRVSSESRQQRILRAFRRVEHPGITALGTSRGDELLVVVECTSATADMRARRVILTLDLQARRVDAPVSSDDFYESTTPDQAYVAGSSVPRLISRLMPSDRLRRTP